MQASIVGETLDCVSKGLWILPITNDAVKFRSRPMSTEHEKIEEGLRSDLYTALVQLSTAAPHEKLEIAERLSEICRKLHQVLIHGNTPEKQR